VMGGWLDTSAPVEDVGSHFPQMTKDFSCVVAGRWEEVAWEKVVTIFWNKSQFC